MATYGKKLLDSEGNIILPKTRSSLVYMDDNETVEDKINSILSEITKIKDGTTVVGLSKVFLDANNPDIKYFLYASDSGNSDSPVVLYDASNSKNRIFAYADNDRLGQRIDTTYMPKSGGTFSGDVLAYNTNRATWCLRNSIITNSGWGAVASNALWFRRG